MADIDIVDLLRPMNGCEEFDLAAAEIVKLRSNIAVLTRRVEELERELSAAARFMTTARTDVEAGAIKETVGILNGGIKRARSFLPTPPQGGDHG